MARLKGVKRRPRALKEEEEQVASPPGSPPGSPLASGRVAKLRRAVASRSAPVRNDLTSSYFSEQPSGSKREVSELGLGEAVDEDTLWALARAIGERQVAATQTAGSLFVTRETSGRGRSGKGVANGTSSSSSDSASAAVSFDSSLFLSWSLAWRAGSSLLVQGVGCKRRVGARLAALAASWSGPDGARPAVLAVDCAAPGVSARHVVSRALAAAVMAEERTRRERAERAGRRGRDVSPPPEPREAAAELARLARTYGAYPVDDQLELLGGKPVEVAIVLLCADADGGRLLTEREARRGGARAPPRGGGGGGGSDGKEEGEWEGEGGEGVGALDGCVSESGCPAFPPKHLFPLSSRSPSLPVLARLAALPNVRLAAVADHVDALGAWDGATLAAFRWAHCGAHTLLPRLGTPEARAVPCLLAPRRAGAGRRGARAVLSSLAASARAIFGILLDAKADPETFPAGLPFDALLRRARERFLVSSDAALKRTLAEFFDHGLVVAKRAHDGTEGLWITLADDEAANILEEIRAEEDGA